MFNESLRPIDFTSKIAPEELPSIPVATTLDLNQNNVLTWMTATAITPFAPLQSILKTKARVTFLKANLTWSLLFAFVLRIKSPYFSLHSLQGSLIWPLVTHAR